MNKNDLSQMILILINVFSALDVFTQLPALKAMKYELIVQ